MNFVVYETAVVPIDLLGYFKSGFGLIPILNELIQLISAFLSIFYKTALSPSINVLWSERVRVCNKQIQL